MAEVNLVFECDDDDEAALGATYVEEALVQLGLTWDDTEHTNTGFQINNVRPGDEKEEDFD